MRIANKAISISPRAKAWLKNSQQPKVLQVFAPVVNLGNENGEVLSIVLPGIGNGPFSLVVDGGQFDQFIDQGSRVEIGEDGVIIGDHFFGIEGAELWNSIPDWETIRNSDLTHAVPLIQAILGKEAAEDSIARFLFDAAGSPDIKFVKVTRAGIADITTGLNKRDSALIRIGAGRLSGLGIGLTPAGDDFLVGLMQGLWATCEPDWVKAACKAIIDSAIPMTNTLSAAWLRSAASGEVGEVWHDLFSAMLENDQRKIENSVRRILPTGHTSGADALAGFVHVLKEDRS